MSPMKRNRKRRLALLLALAIILLWGAEAPLIQADNAKPSKTSESSKEATDEQADDPEPTGDPEQADDPEPTGDSEQAGDSERTGDSESAEDSEQAPKGYDFPEPILFDFEAHDLLDEASATEMMQGILPEVTFEYLHPEDEYPAVVFYYTNNTLYPIVEYRLAGRVASTGEAMTFLFNQGTVMPGETSIHQVLDSEDFVKALEKPENLEIIEVSAMLQDAPNNATRITYDLQRERIIGSSYSNTDDYRTEPFFNPRDFSIELGFDEYDDVSYIIHNNSDKVIVAFRALYKTSEGFALNLTFEDLLLPGESSEVQTADMPVSEIDLSRLEPKFVSIDVREIGEKWRYIYDYDLERFLAKPR